MSRPRGELENAAMGGTVPGENDAQGLQSFSKPMRPNGEIGEPPVDLWGVGIKLNRPLERAQRIVTSPRPIVSCPKITPKMSLIRAQTRCSFVQRNTFVQLSANSVHVREC